MTDTASVKRDLEALEKIQADLAALAKRTDDGRRHELIQHRRLLSTQIAVLGELCEPLFEAGSEDHRQFRQYYSKMRSATALHQAEWPAVRLGEFDEGYRRSASGVHAANQAFVTWLRQKLESL
ncbi:hypothetical protein G4G27_09405 [Sphingomonas sp. So64.6b]|uniref:hypothetical protein n=1 Tax=Sphingomonas sp. So64.6b TaxID=2997354 RepID=UPI001603FACE|nr:hypothetical protein [Sphingomonas sp. So64.6b]QNA84177.1 hypothetical protein G4G27_09405 [Sphingomonas sp. So64.6b]